MNGANLESDAKNRTTIAGELRARLKGDDGARALYATDASNYRQVPIGVVIPKNTDDIIETVAVARAHGAPVLARGGGTSLAGQCCNAAIVMDTSKYLNQLIEIDPTRRSARVQPGIVLDDLNRQARKFGLTFAPDPSTHNHCTLGGMLGNNSCGVHSVLAEFYGPDPTSAHQVEELEILTYDGLRARVGSTQVARALVGSENTCVTILEATVRLIPNPPSRSLLVLGYPSVYEAGDHVPEIREHKPVGLEGMDSYLIRYIRRNHLHPEAAALLPEGER